MPKTWSNRAIDHIDLDVRKSGGMPFEGWLIFGIGFIALCVFSALAINICMHPVQREVSDEPLTMSQPGPSK